MEVSVSFKPNPRVDSGLKKLPDDMLYAIAKQVLDMSSTVIPMSNTTEHSGTLRKATAAGGVRRGNGEMTIGSYTDYATYVWNMNNVNWTTPGTNNKWFTRTLKKHGATILHNAVNRAWKENM